jgi:hypothetical protein
MLAILSALVAGWFISWIGAVAGYLVFVAYAFLRTQLWANDPFIQLSVSAGHGMPTEARIERSVAALVIPPLVAYFVYWLV